MTTKPFICLALTASKPTHEWTFGRKAVEVLMQSDPSFRPERVGRDETEMRKKLPCATADDFRSLWASGRWSGKIVDGLPYGVVDTIYWKRSKKIKTEGSFGQTWVNLKGSILPSWVQMKSEYLGSADYETMFRDWCSLYSPDQAYLHLFSEPEINNAPYVQVTYEQIQAKSVPPEWTDYDNWVTFRGGMFGALWDQKRYNLGAINYFPATFLTESAIQSMETAGISVEPVGSGFLVKICSLSDVLKDFQPFSRQRALAKEIIGLDHFEIKREPTTSPAN